MISEWSSYFYFHRDLTDIERNYILKVHSTSLWKLCILFSFDKANILGSNVNWESSFDYSALIGFSELWSNRLIPVTRIRFDGCYESTHSCTLCSIHCVSYALLTENTSTVKNNTERKIRDKIYTRKHMHTHMYRTNACMHEWIQLHQSLIPVNLPAGSVWCHHSSSFQSEQSRYKR